MGWPRNASAAAARLRAKVRYLGCLSDDARGNGILKELTAEGVDVSNVKRIGRLPIVFGILVDAAGERLICSYNDSNLDLAADWLPPTDIRDVDAVLADVRWPAGAARVLEEARCLGKPAVFDGDVGPREVFLNLAERATNLQTPQPR